MKTKELKTLRSRMRNSDRTDSKQKRDAPTPFFLWMSWWTMCGKKSKSAYDEKFKIEVNIDRIRFFRRGAPVVVQSKAAF